MIKCAVVLSGNGVAHAIAHGTAGMERLYMLMGAIMAKKFMMATSVWMD